MMTETRWSLTDSTFSSAMKSVLDGWGYCHVGDHWSPPPRFLCSIILSFVLSFILHRCAMRLTYGLNLFVK